MSLKQKITEDVKDAMRAKDKPLLNVLRLITAAIKQIEVDKRSGGADGAKEIEDLNDSQVTEVLTKMVKQRRDSLQQFEKAGRDDLVKQEQFELDIIQQYLPEALSEDEINKLIDAAITQTGAAEIKEMGKVMGILKPQLTGRADMGAVSKLIKSRLS